MENRTGDDIIQEQNIIYYLGIIAYGILGFFIKRLINDFDRLQKSVENTKEQNLKEIASIRDNYLKYEEFVRFQTAIDLKLTKIYEILVDR